MRFRKVAKTESSANVRGRVAIFRGRDALFGHPVILRSGATIPVILRSEATKDLLRNWWRGRSRSFAALRMTEGGLMAGDGRGGQSLGKTGEGEGLRMTGR
jgi:hypothetical protein